MTAISFTIEGDAQFTRALTHLYDNFKAPERVWPHVAKVFWDAERRLFDSEGEGRWPHLSSAYLAQKQERFPGQPILRRTGSLFYALSRGPEGGHAIYRSTPDSLTLGTDLPYAAYLQAGTNKMPARPPIDLQERDLAEMLRVARVEFQHLGLQLGFEVTA